MALLTRYLHLTSPEETHIFNFVVTKSVTRDLSRDVVSKDFIFASHKWALSINHHEKVEQGFQVPLFNLTNPTL